MQKHSGNRKNEKDIWNNKTLAYEYDRMAKSGHWRETVLNKIKKLEFSKDFKVLDIGAGPGTHSIPLSGEVRHVTSIEPADAMIDCLKENIKKLNIKNIDCIKKRWEDIDINSELNCPYDVVISSFSLSVYDLKDAIEKMNKCSTKYVYLLWHIGTPDWEKNYLELWKKLYKINYHTVPKTDYIFNLLYQMGIFPNIETYFIKSFYRFSCINHAVDYFKYEFNVSKINQENILRKYLKDKFYKENGHIVMKGFSSYAVIWWKKK